MAYRINKQAIPLADKGACQRFVALGKGTIAIGAMAKGLWLN
jgi:hypothetical protein